MILTFLKTTQTKAHYKKERHHELRNDTTGVRQAGLLHAGEGPARLLAH